MRQYFLKTAAVTALLAFFATGTFAQEDNKEKTIKRSDDVIIIKPKVNVDTKLTIEIKGDDIMVNGKPLAEYKSDDVNISRRKQMIIENRITTNRDEMDAENDMLHDKKMQDEQDSDFRLQQKQWGEKELLRAQNNRFRSNGNTYGNGRSGNMNNMVFVQGMNINNAFLGVGTEKVEDGARVVNVSDESAAAKAGLKEGNVITKINETKVNSPEELTKTIGKFKPNDKITITYKRDKKEQKTTATLTKRKDAEAFGFSNGDSDLKNKNFNYNFNYAPFGENNNFSWDKPRLGLKAQETEEGKGLKVLDVDDESAAEKAGIKEGDIITTFDGTEVNNIDVLRDLSRAAIEKGNFKVNITRDGKPQELTVKIPKNLKSGSL